jgi:hypothetical protein
MAVGPHYGAHKPGQARLRASDADREQVLELLKTAFTEGRLTKEDYEARVERALAGRTYSDLDNVLADLPVPRAPVTPRTNPLAVASLACGAGQLIAWPLATIPAIVLGHMARRQIRRTGETGAGLALAGLALGWAGLGVLLLLLLAGVVFFTAMAHTMTSG